MTARPRRALLGRGVLGRRVGPIATVILAVLWWLPPGFVCADEGSPGEVDLMPTVLELFGIAPPVAINGQSLLPLCGSSPPGDWKNRAVSHLDREGRVGVSLLVPSWKLILESRDEQAIPALYDRRADRRERRDLAAERSEQVGALRSTLHAVLEGSPGGLERPEPAEPPDQQTLERLRALGYVW